MLRPACARVRAGEDRRGGVQRGWCGPGNVEDSCTSGRLSRDPLPTRRVGPVGAPYSDLCQKLDKALEAVSAARSTIRLNQSVKNAMAVRFPAEARRSSTTSSRLP